MIIRYHTKKSLPDEQKKQQIISLGRFKSYVTMITVLPCALNLTNKAITPFNLIPIKL
jgi:hypothetical protein